VINLVNLNFDHSMTKKLLLLSSSYSYPMTEYY